MPVSVKRNVNSRLLPKLLENPDWKELRKELWNEVLKDYKLSWQKAIVDYILIDTMEMKRLRIESIPRGFPKRVIRAPVPWHDRFQQAREAQVQQLFITNDIMAELQSLWWNKYVSLVMECFVSSLTWYTGILVFILSTWRHYTTHHCLLNPVFLRS